MWGSEVLTSPDVSPSGLAEQYVRQERWRRWDEALAQVPVAAGQRVLELGCGVGDVTARLARVGARVTGVDRDEDLLAVARARWPDVDFERADVRSLTPATFGTVDDIWSSFLPAYFPDLAPLLTDWARCLVRGGWCALVEMEDLLGHDQLDDRLVAPGQRLREISLEDRRERLLGLPLGVLRGEDLDPVEREQALEIEGFSAHSVPSLSNVAIRSAGGTNSGEPLRVTFSTKPTMADRVGPSFQDGSGSFSRASEPWIDARTVTSKAAEAPLENLGG